MSAPLLEVRELSRAYPRVQAVRDLSFTMARGQITGFVGPNGAGKTTTMRIAATLDVPDQGDVFVDGVSVLIEPRRTRERIGYMSDQFHPYPNLDVLQYLDFFARAYGLVHEATPATSASSETKRPRFKAAKHASSSGTTPRASRRVASLWPSAIFSWRSQARAMSRL